MSLITPALAEDFVAFCDAFRIPLFAWQREDFGAALRREDGRFKHRLGGISVPRGDGKTHGMGATGTWRLVSGRAPQHISSSALDREGARILLAQSRRIIRNHPDLSAAVKVLADGFVVPTTGSRWTITSRDHESSRGEHPTVVLYDEAGWAKDDELFASLLASQASVDDPLALVASTVGRRKTGPLWTIKQLAEGGNQGVFWAWSGHNRSPKVTARFLDQQRRILMPTQFAREHQNLWVDAADSFTTAAQVDAAMGHGWTEREYGEAGDVHVIYVDIGAVHDPSVVGLGHEAGGIVYVDKLITFQGSRESPVQLATVEAAVIDLCRRFTVREVRVESWQGLAAVQRLQTRGLPVRMFTPTAKSNAEEWPVLAQRLSTGTLVLPVHARLREELLGLVVEMGSHGVKVVDRGKVHQDHAVAVRGVCAQLQPKARRQTIALIKTDTSWQRSVWGERVRHEDPVTEALQTGLAVGAALWQNGVKR